MQPSTRQELVTYCKRQLGAPVLEINVADEQIDDILDDSIQYFQERHFDGVERTYMKYKLTKEDIDQSSDAIKQSSVFLTQLEVPIDVVEYAIEIAKSNNVTTILNPGPAAKLQDKTFELIDYFTPNETEASFYVNHKVETQEELKKASNQLLEKGIKNIIITLGEKGAYFANNNESFMVDAFDLKNKVVDTTGAGDAFNAGLAVALTEGKNIKDAIQFANAVGGLSATKIGTAKSMPLREEIDNLLKLL